MTFKEKILSIKLEKYLTIFLILQPFFDIYMSVIDEKLDVFGFSIITIIRCIFVSVLALITLLKLIINKDKKMMFPLIYLACVAIFIVFHVINGNSFYTWFARSTGNGIMTEMLYVLRLILPVVLIYIVFKDKSTIKNCTKVIVISTAIISTIILITNLFKISLVSYSLDNELIKDNIFGWFNDAYEKFGYKYMTSKGYFNGANEISGLLMCTFPIVIYNCFKNKKIVNYVFMVIQIIAMIMIGSKTATYGWILMYLFYLFTDSILKIILKEKIEIKQIIASVFIISFGVFIMQYSPLYKKIRVFSEYETAYNSIEEDSEINTDYMRDLLNGKKDKKEYINLLLDGKYETSITREKLEQMLVLDDPSTCRALVEDYIYNNFNNHYINIAYIRDIYNYTEDPEFWLNVMDLPFSIKADSRELEKVIVKRLKDRNNNFALDTILGLNDTALKSRGFTVESDFYSHYYTLGIAGLILFVLPYIFILIYASYKVVINIKSKEITDMLPLIISLAAFIGIGFLSGHIFDEYITSLYIAFISGTILVKSVEIKKTVCKEENKDA